MPSARSNTRVGKHLVVMAVWTDYEPSDATASVQVGDMGIKGTGATVSLDAAQVDDRLRQMLRNLQIQEAANYRPEYVDA